MTTEADILREGPLTMENVRNKVMGTQVHRDRISRMGSLVRRSRKGVVMKWTLVNPGERSDGAAETWVWGQRLAAQGYWTSRTTPCPVCHGRTEWQHDTINGTLLESESRCTVCPLWHSGVSFGYAEEQIGFCWFDWRYDQEAGSAAEQESCPPLADRVTALEEIWATLREQEFRALVWSPEGTPLGIIGDWLDDHGFTVQGAGCRLFPPTAYLKPGVGTGSTSFVLGT